MMIVILITGQLSARIVQLENYQDDLQQRILIPATIQTVGISPNAARIYMPNGVIGASTGLPLVVEFNKIFLRQPILA